MKVLEHEVFQFQNKKQFVILCLLEESLPDTLRRKLSKFFSETLDY